MENFNGTETNWTKEMENKTAPPVTEESYSTPFIVLVVFCVIFFVAAVGNLTVFISLFRSRHRKSRISLMIRHLTIADLVVTFFMIPLEIGWRLTVSWLAGNLACKAFLYLRAFGLYLSSNVLVCVSLDRYFAVLHPLKVNDARRRGKCMLTWAWVISLVCAIPQSIVFHVASHPHIENFQQCVTIGFFTSHFQQMAYNLFGLLVMYFIPLFVIIIAYTAIMWEISNKSRDSKRENLETNGRMCLRRSDISNIERARTRTLRMTIMIVVVFIICWTPYVFMTLWYTFDKESAEKVPEWIQATLFMMAVSNSCMNPVVYGSYAINLRKEFCKYFCCLIPSSKNNVTIDSAVTKSTTILHEVPARAPEKKYTILLSKLSSNSAANWSTEAARNSEERILKRNDFAINHFHVENEGKARWHQLKFDKDSRVN